ncbi:SBBP repeat-containing protein [Thermococcus sp.]
MVFLLFSFIPWTSAQSEDYRLIYGTYFGWGNSQDRIISLDVRNGEVYAVGNHARGVNNVDVYYAKLTKSGRDVEYIRFFGGSANEEVTKIRVDGNGSIYIFGKTSSSDLSLKNAFQNRLIGSSDLFVAKFSPEGKLIFSTYFGGEYAEEPYDMEIDEEGNVYIAGYTRHSWGENESLKHIPLKNEKISVESIKKFNFYVRPFIAKFDTNGKLVFSTYWPLFEIRLAPTKDGLYVGGYTVYPDYYVTPGAFDTVCGIKEQKCDPYLGNSDIAITKLDGNLNVVYSTFIGSTGADYLEDLYVDEDGYVYGAGVQAWKNNDFPLKNPSMTKPEGDGADYGIVFKMTPTLSALVYSTYFMREASVHSIRAENGETYIVGITHDANGSHLTTSNALMPKDTSSLTHNAFFAKLDTKGHIRYCTLLGGHEGDYTQREWASEIAVENGEAYIGGYTRAYDFPVTEDSFKEEPGKDLSYFAEGYIVKFGFKEYSPKIPAITLNRSISIGENVWGKDIKETGDGYVILAASDGNPTYPVLVKTDKNGNLVWFKKYTDTAGDFPSLVVENDGYLIFGTKDGKATLIKTDPNGNIMWSKNYAEHGVFQRGGGIIKVQDSYILMGSTNGTRGGGRGIYTELFLANVDKSGNLLWESYINVEKLGMSPDMMPRQVKKTRDGYIIVGDTAKAEKSTTHRIFVLKTNLEGKKEWVRYLGRNSDGKEDYAVGFSVEALDNGYLVTGYVYNNLFGGSDLYIAKLDLAGNLVWETVKGKVENDEPVKILKADDGFVLFDRGMENAWTGKKGYFFKFNDRGIKEYSLDIDMPKQDWALNMERVSDGYLLLLSSDSFSNTRDLWLIKVEAPKIQPQSTGTLANISTQTQTNTPTSKTSTIAETENITETAKEIATSATEKAKEVAKGVCGPGMIVAVVLLPLILRRRKDIREGA